MLFAILLHLAEGLSLDSLLTLKELIFLMGARISTLSIIEQELIRLSETLVGNETSKLCQL
jgi:hypothetical protein